MVSEVIIVIWFDFPIVYCSIEKYNLFFYIDPIPYNLVKLTHSTSFLVDSLVFSM